MVSLSGVFEADGIEAEGEAEASMDVEEYNPFEDLCERHSGVRCPNIHCNDRIFSYEKGQSTACRCGLTWVAGGFQYLKYGVGAPFTLADVQVVSQRLSAAKARSLQEGIDQELGQTVDDSAQVDEVSIVDPQPVLVDDSAQGAIEESRETPSDNFGSEGV